ncbi:MAG TPA: glycosyltransferase family 4 protein [Candidatus Saccharimonadales bacterium]|nr:glycosyltransferase family 4 protein [Candidatus Saccharimonadales bacterium]
MRGDKPLKIGLMVRGYLPAPRPSDMIYAPIDLAVDLAQGLVERGHKVDYFGPIGTQIDGAGTPEITLRPLATNNHELQEIFANTGQMSHYIPALWDAYIAEEMFRQAQLGEYDLLHFHHPEIALPLARRYRSIPVVYTLHDPVFPWYKEVFELYNSPNEYYVSISDNQRRDAPDLPYAATVYNGINTEEFSFSAEHEDYLLYMGRIVPEKGVKEAVQVAEATNHRLLIIGPTYPSSQGYFDQYIKPYLNDKILYLGYIDRRQLRPYYQKAKALLAPIQWEEPFGLTSIEAMACGTPVIAIARGSMPEIVEDGKTGYLVASVGEMIDAVRRVNKLDRRACRDHVKANFGTRQMVEGYEAVYRQVLSGSSGVRRLQRRVVGKVQRGMERTTEVARKHTPRIKPLK